MVKCKINLLVSSDHMFTIQVQFVDKVQNFHRLEMLDSVLLSHKSEYRFEEVVDLTAVLRKQLLVCR